MFASFTFWQISCHSSVSGIQCYRCLPKAVPPSSSSNQTTFLEPCSQFDGSNKFVIDCPLSTFCMKRNFTLEFPDGSECHFESKYGDHVAIFSLFLLLGNAIVTERGCAQQSFSYRVLKRGQWQTVNDVNETIYQDGCILENQGTKPPTQYCYCSSRLCNSASPIHFNQSLIYLIVLFTIHIVF